MIGILNYGLGNIRSFYNLYKTLDIQSKFISSSNELIDVKRLILPGVGSFDYAMEKFNNSGLRDQVENMVLNDKIPLLGVCVGMQMLAKSSDEGTNKGLGWIDANVSRFDLSVIKDNLRLPHMGWNTINIEREEPLFKNLNNQSRFYFLHSYYFKCNIIEESITKTNYGSNFTSSIRSDNIYGVQFHPEKSHDNGIKLLYNFSNI